MIEPTEHAAPLEGSEPDPGRLVRLIEDGDPRAEEELVTRYSLGLKVMLRQLTRDFSLAEDIHQETFALALTKIRQGELRQPEALAAFLRSIARNLLLADRRKEARYSSLDEDLDGQPQALAGRQVAEAPQLRQALAAEEARLVRQVLGELRYERDRQLLLRYYLTDSSKEDICRDLEVDPELFNRVLYRARQRLRELWERAEKRRRLGVVSLLVIFFATWTSFAALPSREGRNAVRGA